MQDEVRSLICRGLAERFGHDDPAQNPDLRNIASNYAGQTFLVATTGDRIVGTGALVQESPDVGRIVRMSVEPSLRRRGIGSRILVHLIAAARASRYRRLVIETTATWQDAIDFYVSHGFVSTGVDPERKEAHFALSLCDRHAAARPEQLELDDPR